MSLDKQIAAARVPERPKPNSLERIHAAAQIRPVPVEDVHRRYAHGADQVGSRLTQADAFFQVHEQPWARRATESETNEPNQVQRERPSGEYPIDRARQVPTSAVHERMHNEEQKRDQRHEVVARRYSDIAMQIARDQSEVQRLQESRSNIAPRASYDHAAANAVAALDYDIATRLQRSTQLNNELRVLGEELEQLNTSDEEREEHRFQAQHERFQRGYIHPEMADTPKNPEEINRQYFNRMAQEAGQLERQLTELQQGARRTEERLAQLMNQQFVLDQAPKKVGGFFKNLTSAANGFLEKRKLQGQIQQELVSLRKNGEQMDRIQSDWRKLQDQLPEQMRTQIRGQVSVSGSSMTQGVETRPHGDAANNMSPEEEARFLAQHQSFQQPYASTNRAR